MNRELDAIVQTFATIVFIIAIGYFGAHVVVAILKGTLS